MNIGLPQKTLKGDGARLRSVAFDPAAGEVAAVNELGELQVWDLSTGKQRWSVKSPHGGARLLAVTPDSKLARAMPFDDYYGRTAFSFDTQTGVNAAEIELGSNHILQDFLDRWVLCAAKPDNSAVTCSTEGGVVEFTPTGAMTKVTTAASSVNTIADLVYSPDGRELAVADTAVGVTLYQLGGGGRRALYKASPNGVGGSRVAVLAYASNASRLAGGEFGTNSQMRVWDPASGATIAEFPLPVRLGAVGVALSPDGELVASVDGWTRDVVVHRVSDGKRTDYASTAEPVLPAGPNDNHFDVVTFSPSGARLAAIAFYNESSVIFRVSDGTPEFLLPGGGAGVSFLDEATLLRGEPDGTISVWCLE
jgi:WD40 repeat protein